MSRVFSKLTLYLFRYKNLSKDPTLKIKKQKKGTLSFSPFLKIHNEKHCTYVHIKIYITKDEKNTCVSINIIMY